MFSAKIHDKIYLISLLLLVASLPFSVYLTSVSQFLLLTNWVIEANFKYKFEKFKKNKSLWVFLILVLILLLSLFNTSDYAYAIKDLQIKLPLLALPVIIATSRTLSFRKIKLIMLVFTSALLINTLIGVVYYSVNTSEFENIRDMSLFISHIRLSLMINLSIFSLLYFLYYKKTDFKFEKFIYIFAILWFIVYLLWLQAFTGITVFVVVLFLLIIYKLIVSKNKKVKYISLASLLAILFSLVISFGVALNNFYPDTYPNIENLPKYTKLGNPYYHDYSSKLIENGNLIYINISEIELRQVWAEKSSLSIDSLDAKNQPVIHTIIRYLSSLNLTKDAEGLNNLNPDDIRAIEDGKANVRFKKGFTIDDRFYQIIWQLDVYFKGGNPSGHSVTQRLEYLKTGFYILGNNFFTGVGIGDVDQEYKEAYRKMPTPLKEEFQHRAHNQFLTFFIAFGAIGGILAMAAIFYPVIMSEGYKKYLFIVFLAIAVLSMLADDTLETAAGVTFFAFFYSLFLWGFKIKTDES
ncbi:MAG TPA: O-antigen ligase family protein [Bacteroidales bacterium]|nr:O-antigen ligase family protein [Bacteroidales bacterium]